MTEKIALGGLTRERLTEVASAAVLVLPFGAVEQHGPHLPFGTDFFVVDAIARRAGEQAAEEAPVVLAPAVPYGSSDHHLGVGGALSLSASTFGACSRDLLSSAAASGFRRIFVVNGHGGNDQLLRVAAQAATGGAPFAVAGGSYWALAKEALARIVPPGCVPGHAGRFETSLVLALRLGSEVTAPMRAGQEAPAASLYWHEDPRVWTRIDGYTDNPAQGTAEEGSACLDAIVSAVARCIIDFHHATEEAR